MNLTKEISSRRLDFKPTIEVRDKIVFIAEIATEIHLQNNWETASNEMFEAAKSNFIFPEIDELSSNDKKNYKESIFSPLLFLVSKRICQHGFRPIILTYLYRKESLTGPIFLNIRSINKFEMMWAPYLLESKGPFRTNLKVFNISDYPASISKPLNFVFRSKLHDRPIESKLRTLTIDLGKFILALYIVDNITCQLSEDEISEFIQKINIKAIPHNTEI